jgi:hypothetical protein
MGLHAGRVRLCRDRSVHRRCLNPGDHRPRGAPRPQEVLGEGPRSRQPRPHPAAAATPVRWAAMRLWRRNVSVSALAGEDGGYGGDSRPITGPSRAIGRLTVSMQAMQLLSGSPRLRSEAGMRSDLPVTGRRAKAPSGSARLPQRHPAWAGGRMTHRPQSRPKGRPPGMMLCCWCLTWLSPVQDLPSIVTEPCARATSDSTDLDDRGHCARASPSRCWESEVRSLVLACCSWRAVTTEGPAPRRELPAAQFPVGCRPG